MQSPQEGPGGGLCGQGTTAFFVEPVGRGTAKWRVPVRYVEDSAVNPGKFIAFLSFSVHPAGRESALPSNHSRTSGLDTAPLTGLGNVTSWRDGRELFCESRSLDPPTEDRPPVTVLATER